MNHPKPLQESQTMPEGPNGKTRKRIPELDGLRGVAILMVLVWHYFVAQFNSKSFPEFDFLLMTPLNLTWSGVDLFFVLSGFLIGGILIEQRTSPTYFKTFYLRRFCRILPAYYLVLVLLLVASALGLTHEARFDWLFQKLHPLWSYVTFTQSFPMVSARNLGGSWLGPTWSLAVEEQFYLVLPLMVRLCTPRNVPYMLAVFILLAPVLRVLIIFVWPADMLANYILMPCRADSLLLGALCAWAWGVPAITECLKANTRGIHWVLGALFCGVAVIGFGKQSQTSTFMWLFGYAWLAAFYLVVLLLCLVEKHGFVPWLCRNSFLQRLGSRPSQQRG
jgi:peptidoglycan/LPS O-acetylase OafA/YrhL